MGSKELIDDIKKKQSALKRQIRLMEVCGTHTVSIFRHGIRGLLPKGISLISGPGCPVCVTSVEDIERAISIARNHNIIFTTFGDMMRVPGIKKSLSDIKAEGADIRVVYSPLDVLKIASDNKDKKIVFFATGFETTSPSVAATLLEADKQGLGNFYIYSVHKLVNPALKILDDGEALLGSGEIEIDGFILPGHVSTIIGSRPYDFIAKKYKNPCVITGFDAEDILKGIDMLLEQIINNRSEVEIQYKSVVREEGNPRALEMLNEFFESADACWRGIGMIPLSGLRLKKRYGYRDISNIIDTNVSVAGHEPSVCSCGEILKGIKTPYECSLFGNVCTPETPVGACMVSTEGSCAAYYKYGGFGG